MKTIVDKNIGIKVDGYVVNTSLEASIIDQIKNVQYELKEAFGDSVWCVPEKSLHITLMDWLAPLVDYGKEKDQLFKEIQTEYDEKLQKIIENHTAINLKPIELGISQNAIFIKFDDGGVFNQIRNEFTQEVKLIEGTKPPAQIVHTTIARFTREIDLSKVELLLKDCQISRETIVDKFRLVHETKTPMLESQEIKTYLL